MLSSAIRRRLLQERESCFESSDGVIEEVESGTRQVIKVLSAGEHKTIGNIGCGERSQVRHYA